MSDQPDRTDAAAAGTGADAPASTQPDPTGAPGAVAGETTAASEPVVEPVGTAAGDAEEQDADQQVADVDGDDGEDEDEDEDEGSLLDQEGDAAADYLEELLDIADLDGDIDIFEENGRASVAIVAEGADARALKQLIGRDGAVLDALQELTRLAAQARTGERSRLLLDIGGWREARRAEAAQIAKDAMERAKASGQPVDLEPMPAYQRKAVHDAVAAAGLRSESDGVEPSRYVVVHPA